MVSYFLSCPVARLWANVDSDNLNRDLDSVGVGVNRALQCGGVGVNSGLCHTRKPYLTEESPHIKLCHCHLHSKITECLAFSPEKRGNYIVKVTKKTP